ncbi:TPA: hypothetical protein QDZ99_004519 [Stenotrophomonas maltophilia]|nr:hypothetical protein [Stenotrophomonas maltophilia]HDS1158684.1 hypothetical protein [Stenotrophomonas maltophilia]HDS1168184.1 hypothetical protein [Stenotrophomonas maltophilia]HDS1172757.1 hypothetical protein [Stenotrophomonas maltophilia]HDS1174822.1 hypothetical protein [Stenotrophomonas maltophilia]
MNWINSGIQLLRQPVFKHAAPSFFSQVVRGALDQEMNDGVGRLIGQQPATPPPKTLGELTGAVLVSAVNKAYGCAVPKPVRKQVTRGIHNLVLTSHTQEEFDGKLKVHGMTLVEIGIINKDPTGSTYNDPLIRKIHAHLPVQCRSCGAFVSSHLIEQGRCRNCGVLNVLPR